MIVAIHSNYLDSADRAGSLEFLDASIEIPILADSSAPGVVLGRCVTLNVADTAYGSTALTDVANAETG